MILSKYSLHPRNILFSVCRDKLLYNDLIIYIMSFLRISDRLEHIPSDFEHVLFKNLSYCRDENGKAISMISYYENINHHANTVIETLSSNWILMTKNDFILQYKNSNKYFDTIIQIINDDDDEDYASPLDIIVDRYISCEFIFHSDTITYISSKTRQNIQLLFKKYVQFYGYFFEGEDANYFSFQNNHLFSESIILTKKFTIYSYDMNNPCILDKARLCSIPNSLGNLLHLYDEMYHILLK